MGCTDVSATPSKLLLNQNGSEFDKINRYDSFANVYTIVDSNGNCPPGMYAQCRRLNDPDFTFCLEGFYCPITDLQITVATGVPDPIFEKNKFFSSSSGKRLWYSNKGNFGPITDLRLSQSRPCFNPDRISWGKSRPEFPLNHPNVRSCMEDERYI